MITTWFAYRMPDENDAHFIRGEAVPSHSLGDLTDTGFVFHSFTGDVFLQIRDYEVIDEDRFRCFAGNPTGDVIWTQAEYLDAFSKVRGELGSGRLQKVVLSRLREAATEKTPLEIFKELNRIYSSTFNYVLSNPELGTWIGATPELLLESSGDQLATVSLAGTKTADGQSSWTSKEKTEQQYVTDFITEVLIRHHCTGLELNGPVTVSAGPVEHLKTFITARLSGDQSLGAILSDLHPTPATCGIPKEEAKQMILAVEAHNREMYTGFIGVLTPARKRFYVNLRCMKMEKTRVLLYVGGGITNTSKGEMEWLETEKKAVTLLKVLH